MDSELPDRHRPAHYPPLDRNDTSTIVFVTFCLNQRKPLLATADVHSSLRTAWEKADQWKIGYYLIMPDHIHLFCAPGVAYPCNLLKWSRYWKRLVSRDCPELNGCWQNGFWDTQIRNGRHYQTKLNYVGANPVRKDFVLNAEDWDYQGKMCQLTWHGE